MPSRVNQTVPRASRFFNPTSSRNATGSNRQLRYEALEARCMMTAGIVQESGDIVAEIQRLKGLAFQRDSNFYVAPAPSQIDGFASLAFSLREGDVNTASAQAAALDYELVEFTDTASGQILHELRERLIDGRPIRGWGTFVINLGFQSDTLVEVPHPLFDTNSWDVGAKVFRRAGARGFLMAGAHRDANGTGTADVAHLTDSIFQTVHHVWNGPTGQTTAWQVHGFDLSRHDGDPGENHFPDGTDVVISNGDGGISPHIVQVDGHFEDHGFDSYGYNTLSVSHPLNVEVNGGVDGTTFSSLAATTNVQGIQSREVGGAFVHIELEQSIRFDAVNRDLAATLISHSMVQPSTKFFVVDTSDDETFQYDSVGNLVDAYGLGAGNTTPRGAAADATGQTLWVMDNDDFVYVYDADGSSLGQWHANGLNRPEGIATDGQDIWIVDRGTDRVYFFAQAASRVSGDDDPTSSFNLAPGNSSPRGITTDGSHIWVVNASRTKDKVFKYNVAGTLLGSWVIDLANDNPRGITTDPADPANLWIVDNNRDAIYQYLGGGSRVSGTQSADAFYPLSSGNDNPQGLADPPPTTSSLKPRVWTNYNPRAWIDLAIRELTSTRLTSDETENSEHVSSGVTAQYLPADSQRTQVERHSIPLARRGSAFRELEKLPFVFSDLTDDQWRSLDC